MGRPAWLRGLPEPTAVAPTDHTIRVGRNTGLYTGKETYYVRKKSIQQLCISQVLYIYTSCCFRFWHSEHLTTTIIKARLLCIRSRVNCAQSCMSSRAFHVHRTKSGETDADCGPHRMEKAASVLLGPQCNSVSLLLGSLGIPDPTNKPPC